jgi:GTP diphosphokinase / guanosine-3',5'-bis(diphosphate) 3'-diphosphatase
LSLKKYEDKLDSTAPFFGFARADELIAGVGLGKISARQVLNRLEPDIAGTEAGAASESAWSSVVRKVFRRGDSPIQVKGHDDLLVYRARCCNPIKGENVVGYITVGRGISVHSADCPNLNHLLLHSERRVEVQWTQDGDSTRYPVRLSIQTMDRTGLLADITAAVSGISANIVDARARVLEESGEGLVEITVEVQDRKHLEKLVNHLRKIGGVRDVERTVHLAAAGRSRAPHA